MLLNLVDACLEAFKSASLFHKLDHILCIVILSCRCFEGQEASLLSNLIGFRCQCQMKLRARGRNQ